LPEAKAGFNFAFLFACPLIHNKKELQRLDSYREYENIKKEMVKSNANVKVYKEHATVNKFGEVLER
jgi:hypothetical protein